jgi:polysaccharide biosynthesis transport protein
MPGTSPIRKAAQQARPEFSAIQLRSPAEYLLLIRLRWWWGLLLGLMVGLPIAWMELQKPITYTSSGSIIFQRESSQTVLDVRAASDVDQGLRFHMAQMTSSVFLDSVATTFTAEEIALIQSGYLTNPTEQPPSVRDLLGSVSLSPVADLQIIRATARGKTPEEPALLVNRMLDQFVRQRAEQTAQTDTGALVFLRQQSSDLQKRIEDSEKSLVEFRQDRKLVSIEDTQALITARMSTLTSAVTQLRTERLELEPLLAEIHRIRAEGGDTEIVGRIQSNPAVSSLRAELRRLQTEAAALERRYLERHPKVIENTRRMAEVQASRDEAVAQAAQAFEDRLLELNKRETLLRAELAEAGSDQIELDKASVELGVLRRQIETDSRTLDRILTQISEQEIASQLAGANVRRWEFAAPGWGVGPDRTKIIGMVIALIAAFVIGIPIAADLIDQRLKSSGDVETQLHASLIGEIPELKAFERGANSFLGSDNTNDAFMESFRGIYSQLTLQTKVEGTRRIVITSSVPGEGKSFVTCNIAAVFASHHKRTIIIDCDLRRPTQHTFLGVPEKPGSLQWIDSTSELKDADANIPGLCAIRPNLWFLASGGATRHPTEVLSHERFTNLVELLGKRFDVLIFDTPPIGLFPDALVVARMCQEAVFVARFAEVSRGRIRTYVNRLASAVPTFHGVIMNRMPENPRSPYYYKGYNYGSEKYAEYYKQSRT